MEMEIDQQKQQEYEIVLPNELIQQIVMAIPEDEVRQEKNISKNIDYFIGERRKAALAAEIADRMKGKESEQLDQIKFDLLLQASKDGYVWRMRQLLMPGGVNADWLRENKDNLLHDVIDRQNASVAVVKLLLDHGVPVDGRSSYNCITPLHFAATYATLDVCELLISHGADPNAEEYFRTRPLHWAASADIVKLLLKNGAKLDAVDMIRQNCLHAAINHMDNAKIILDYAENNGGLEAKKALMDARDEYGRTPLHWAYYHKKLDMAKWLEEQGADKDIMNNHGEKPCELTEFYPDFTLQANLQ